jgi:acid-sensing ion channel, other
MSLVPLKAYLCINVIFVLAQRLWGEDHDFTLEEVLSEIAYFRGESYHTVHECGETADEGTCFYTNFSIYAHLVRSPCRKTIAGCFWNDKEFDCCEFFLPMHTEIGICYALNSDQGIDPHPPRLKMPSDKFTGMGKLKLELMTESFVYTLGVEDVPNLVTPKTDILQVDHYISYKRLISVRNIENDPDTRTVSVAQRSCRFPDENILDVHRFYSYSACSVQCRKREQMKICNCTSHLMPNTGDFLFSCQMKLWLWTHIFSQIPDTTAT